MTKLFLTCVVVLWASLASAQTRLYMPIDTAADVSPTPDAGWDFTGEVVYRQLEITKGASTVAVGQTLDFDNGDANVDEVDRIYVSNPLAGGITFTSGVTTVKMYLQGRQLGSTDDIRNCVTAITIVSNDGTSISATLRALTAVAGSGEFVTTAGGRNKPCITSGTTLGASHTTSAGERLVVEVGGRVDADGGTTPQLELEYGESEADCAEDESSTTDCSPWIEFSNTITEQGAGTGKPATWLPLLLNLWNAIFFRGLL